MATLFYVKEIKNLWYIKILSNVDDVGLYCISVRKEIFCPFSPYFLAKNTTFHMVCKRNKNQWNSLTKSLTGQQYFVIDYGTLPEDFLMEHQPLWFQKEKIQLLNIFFGSKKQVTRDHFMRKTPFHFTKYLRLPSILCLTPLIWKF